MKNCKILEIKPINLDQPSSKNITTKTSKESITPKSLKELARDNIKLNNRDLDKMIAKKMINPYYFKDKGFYDFLKIN